jgi:sulfur-oxidizing protein SoxX
MHPASNAKKVALIVAAVSIMVGVCGCASKSNDASTAQTNLPPIRASFAAKGVAGMDRLDQDEVQRLCTQYAQKPIPAEVADKIQQSQLATVKLPASGKLMGDWKAGEALAQEGRGLQFSDKTGGPQGGNCYACHQLTHEEIAYGNVGPSLLNYGKLRGQSEAIVHYTYAKLYNSQAYAACSNMPRFGHNRILMPEQLADIVALLIDPQSPVNR